MFKHIAICKMTALDHKAVGTSSDTHYGGRNIAYFAFTSQKRDIILKPSHAQFVRQPWLQLQIIPLILKDNLKDI